MPSLTTARLAAMTTWAERRQIPLYLVAIAVALTVGLTAPDAHRLEAAINPVLSLLLYVTFLGVPFATIGRSLRDGRFLGAVVVVNFVVVPVVAWGLSRFVADDRAVLFGVLLVLLTPCIDYVIVFAGLAGGASARLLAAAPMLMVAQMLILPGYLFLIVGAEGVRVVEVDPFVEAFLVLIVVPLTAAAGTQELARRSRVAARTQGLVLNAMVPLMMATLFVVVASQGGAVGAQATRLLAVVPVFAGFLVVMVFAGAAAGRVARLDMPARRALAFSGATRNSLVVLPLALALPQSMDLAPVVVVTQTLVELIGMVVLVRVVPRLIPDSHSADHR